MYKSFNWDYTKNDRSSVESIAVGDLVHLENVGMCFVFEVLRLKESRAISTIRVIEPKDGEFRMYIV